MSNMHINFGIINTPSISMGHTLLRQRFGRDYYALGKPVVKYNLTTKTERVTGTGFTVPPHFEAPIVILLGGEFQKVGGEFEDVGGGYQKVG